jgi:hypothetical protein
VFGIKKFSSLFFGSATGSDSEKENITSPTQLQKVALQDKAIASKMKGVWLLYVLEKRVLI